MHIVVFLIVGLSSVSLSSRAEESMVIAQETSDQTGIDPLTNQTNSSGEAPVIVIAAEPESPSIQAALAAPDDSYVEGKDLNTDDEDSENPDEADEDGEEDSDEESEDGTDDEDEED